MRRCAVLISLAGVMAEQASLEERPAAESVDKMVCYEAALQPRPQDDVDFYLQAVMIHTSFKTWRTHTMR